MIYLGQMNEWTPRVGNFNGNILAGVIRFREKPYQAVLLYSLIYTPIDKIL